MDVTKPYEFIGFGAMDVTKPYEFIGFGARTGSKPITDHASTPSSGTNKEYLSFRRLPDVFGQSVPSERHSMPQDGLNLSCRERARCPAP
jgi:hypothetical protein